MDYQKAAREVYEHIGGKENIVSAAHCATRLRLVIGDNAKCDKDAIENIDGVKGVFFASGQLQIIFGTGTVSKIFPAMADSGTYTIIHLFSNAAFTFLPILIAVSAARVFGGNLFLGAVIGMIMVHPDLMNAWSVATAESVPQATAWFGLYNIDLVGYQGHVIPVVIAVWFMSALEKKLHKIVPEIIDLFVTPLVTVLVTGYLTLTIFGPVFSFIENGVLDGVRYLITLPFGIGAALAGAIYPFTVVAGVHHMYNALEAGLLSADGINTWMPIATAANVAQGAAALAVALKAKNQKMKSLALPASLSAFMGITEPAIFGVNLRLFKPFLAGAIGGACGALVAGITGIGATAYGITGIFGYLITTNYTLQYTLVMAVAVAVAFVISWFLYREEKPAEKTETKAEIREEVRTEPYTVYAPIEGTVIPLSEVPDETFAAEVLGKGAAIRPAKGEVKAPVSGTVTTLFETKHAVGITSEDGVEILIHVGINTLELGGKYYDAHVSEGDTVKAGDLLLTFDMEQIQAAGYEAVTPVIISNTDDYADVENLKMGTTRSMEPILKVNKE